MDKAQLNSTPRVPFDTLPDIKRYSYQLFCPVVSRYLFLFLFFFVVFSFFGVTIILFSNFFRGYDPDFYIKICLIYFGDVFLFCLSGLWVYHLGAQYYFNPQHIV